MLGVSYLFQAEYRQGMEVLARSIPILEQSGKYADAALSFAVEGLISGTMGDFSNGIDYVEEELRIAQSIGSRTLEAAAHCHAAWVYCMIGDWDNAISRGMQGVALAHKTTLRPSGRWRTTF